MLPIVDKPTIQYIVEEALQSGIEEILIITGHGKRAIEDHFDTNIDLELQLRQQGKDQLLHLVQDISSINIHYIRQKHMRGLGDAIRCAESFIDNEPFAVLLGDDVVYNPEQPALKQMMDAFSRRGGYYARLSGSAAGTGIVLRHRPGPADGRRPRRQAHRHGRKAGMSTKRRAAWPRWAAIS